MLVWAGTFKEAKVPDEYQLAALNELICLIEENYDEWVVNLDEQIADLNIAAKWMKQSLVILLENIREGDHAVGYTG